jgi:hypothetical protein
VASGHQQGVPKQSFVGKLGPRAHQGSEEIFVYVMVGRFGPGNGLRMQPDVYYVPFAHVRLVLGQQEAEFGQLERNRVRGFYNRRTGVGCIHEEAGGYIDGDYGSAAAVDGLHHPGRHAFHRPAQARAEEGVDHQAVCREGGNVGLRFDFAGGKQSFNRSKLVAKSAEVASAYRTTHTSTR